MEDPINMSGFVARVSDGGRVVIPADFRRELDLREGDSVIVRLEGGVLQLVPLRQALHRAQQITVSHVSEDRSLADELLSERHRESLRD